MQRADGPEASALAAQVQAFVRQFALPIVAGSPAALSWLRALREQGWYVPHWPASHGGLGWAPWQIYVLQRELLAAGALLPPGATTQLVASWIFEWLQSGPQSNPTLGRRWLDGIAGVLDMPEYWRVGLDMRRPDWPAQAQSDGFAGAGAHWVLQPRRDASHGDAEPTWTIGVLRGRLLPAGIENLDPTPSHQALTEVELGVERHWQPIAAGLSLAEVEAMLRPVQLAWQDPNKALGVTGEVDLALASGLVVPSRGLQRRLARVAQALPAAKRSEHRALQESLIALAGLQITEARAAQADASVEPVLSDATLIRAVADSAERLGWQVAQLEADTLGYFALPVFDAELQHNEGPVTPAQFEALVTSQDRSDEQ